MSCKAMIDIQGPTDATPGTERQFRMLIQAVTHYAIYKLSPSRIVTSWNVGAERLKG
jgi:hypothetical protein